VSRKQFTTLVVELKVPQAPKHTQKEILNWVKGAMLQEGSPFASFAHQVQVKLVGHQTTYL
jgi:hypothetical protein